MPMQSPESASDIKFEIGHVLFIDIVGYSKLLITEQSDQIQKLKEIIRGAEQFGIPKLKANFFGYQPVMVWHSFFALTRKRRCYAQWKLARHLKIIRSFACAWEFTAAQSMKSLILTRKRTSPELGSTSLNG